MAAIAPGGRLHAFASVVRDLHPALPARQQAAGWVRLQESLAAGGKPAERAPRTWSPGRLLPFGIGLALATAAMVFAIGPRLSRAPVPQPLQFVIKGDIAPGDGGGVLAAHNGPVELLFTDGSRVDMQPAARLSVNARDAAGSDIRLVDGTIDVDVRHRPGTSWTFQAGAYAVNVKGTSFLLAWNERDGRLTLRMKTGLVTVTAPGGAAPRSVAAGESLTLGGATPPVEAPPPREMPAVETPPPPSPR
ncbi:MAG: FecR domain-containing protein, partial [Pseudomonadota bacterium]